MTQTPATRVLLTGFGPFPGVPNNVSSEIAKDCAAAWSGRADVEAYHFSLATDWQTAPRAAAKHVQQVDPDIVIHLGVSEQAKGFVLETHAYNECCASPDVDGATASQVHLDRDAPQHVECIAPVQDIATRLTEKDLPVTISNDPGRYLCNAVYHKTLSSIASRQDGAVVLFIHIPVTPSETTVTKTQIISGLDIVLSVLLGR